MACQNYGPFQKLQGALRSVKIDQSQIFDLNTPSDRPCQELLNACFNFEIGQSKLKLWALKVATCMVIMHYTVRTCFHILGYFLSSYRHLSSSAIYSLATDL